MSESEAPKLLAPSWLDGVFPDPVEALAYSSPSLEVLFKDAAVVFDTNALLAPYQVGNQSVDEIATIYRELAGDDRLFIPYQVAREFAKNRGVKLADMHTLVHSRLSTLPKLEPLDCPMLEGIDAYQAPSPLVATMKEHIRKYKKLLGALKEHLAEWGWNDRVSTLYREVFTANRLITHEKDDLALGEELKRRVTHDLPPAFRDKSKPDGGVGDLAIWLSILRMAKQKSVDVVFVCNEKKNDWVYRSNDEALTPRMELCIEFLRETACHFALISWPRFLQLAGAKHRTVQEAKQAEEATPGVTYLRRSTRFRLRAVLRALYDILQAGPQDPGTGYSYITARNFDSLVRRFRETKAAYEHIGPAKEALEHIDRLAEILDQIAAINSSIRTMEIRMKESGDRQSALLSAHCLDFGDAYELWRASPAAQAI